MQPNQNLNRPADKVVTRSQSIVSRDLFLIGSFRVRMWHFLLGVVFVVGFASALFWAADQKKFVPSEAAGLIGADGKTFDQRKADWVSSTSSQANLDITPHSARQHVLAWIEAGSHTSCRSSSVLQSLIEPKIASGVVKCQPNADYGTPCMYLYLDSQDRVEKLEDWGGGNPTYQDLDCVTGNIPGLIRWKGQSGSNAPATLARMHLQYSIVDSELQQYWNGIVSDGNFLDASPSDLSNPRVPGEQRVKDMQPLQTAVHYLAALANPSATVMYDDRGEYFSRTFSYGGNTYVPGGGPYNALQFTRDWMYDWMNKVIDYPNAETNSRSYQHQAITAMQVLHDFGDQDMKRRAKMFLDFVMLDSGLQFALNINHWGGLFGRTYRSTYVFGSDPTPWHIYWGANNAHLLSQIGFVSSYRLSSFIEQFPYMSTGDWVLKKDSYRNNVLTTSAFSIAVDPSDGSWRIIMRDSNGQGFPFDFWINDLAGDSDPNVCSNDGATTGQGRTVSICGGGECYTCTGMNGSMYRNNILLQNISQPTLHFVHSGNGFDEVQGKIQPTEDSINGYVIQNEYFLNNNQWNYFREGKAAVAINPGPGTGGIEVAIVDGSCSEDFCYPSFQDFTSKSRSVGSASFTNGKGIVIDSSKTYVRPSQRLLAETNNSSKYVSWTNRVMTVGYNGTCSYDFNSWTTSPAGCENASSGGDQIPPVISSVSNSSTTSTSTIVSWSTDEPSDSQVEYGLTTSYGNSTMLNPTLLTNHSASLTSLNANTTYHYRVKSKDVAGNLATGVDTTFVTLPAANILPDNPYNLSQRPNPGDPAMVEGTTIADTMPSFSFTISDPDQGQIIGYQFQVARDVNFTDLARDFTWAGSATNPNNVIFDILAANALSNGPHWWRVKGLDAAGGSSVWVYFGNQTAMDFTVNTPQSFTLTLTKSGTGSGTVTSSPTGINCGSTCTASFSNNTSVTLTATPNTGSTFVGWSGACTGTGMCNVMMNQNQGVDAAFSLSDTTSPIISGVSSNTITSTGATIAWTTDEASDSQVEYGLTTSYGSSSTVNTSMVTNHSVQLTDLTVSTLYHYRVKSTDASGNLAVSGDYTFTTASLVPTISLVGSNSAGGTSVVIPTHQTGDLMLMFAYRDGGTTAPSAPSGWTTINASGGGSSNSSRLAYKIATSISDTSGTWSGATELVVVVYRNQNPTSPIGAKGSSVGSSSTVTYPALTLQNTSGSSWVVGFAGHRNVTATVQNPPTGMTYHTGVSKTGKVAGHGTNGGVSSWGSKSVSVGVSSGWMSRVVEIKP